MEKKAFIMIKGKIIPKNEIITIEQKEGNQTKIHTRHRTIGIVELTDEEFGKVLEELNN